MEKAENGKKRPLGSEKPCHEKNEYNFTRNSCGKNKKNIMILTEIQKRINFDNKQTIELWKYRDNK